MFAEHATYPAIADVTGDFVYARLQKGQEKLKAGYPPKALDDWAARAKTWAGGGAPADLPCVDLPIAKAEETAARRFHLFHPRGQGARPRRGHGADRAASDGRVTALVSQSDRLIARP